MAPRVLASKHSPHLTVSLPLLSSPHASPSLQPACPPLPFLLLLPYPPLLPCRWFRGVHWGRLEARQVAPKFRPTVSGERCTANFDEMWTRMPVTDSPAGTPTQGELTGAAAFRNYTFVGPRGGLVTVESDSEEEEVEGVEDEEEEEEDEEGEGEVEDVA